MTKYITVLGSSNTDLIIRVPELPKPGETILGGSFETAFGGKGANQAVAASRAGGHVHFIGKIGVDSNGDQALAALDSDGIRTLNVIRDHHNPSGVAMIFVSESGENCIAVAGGSNMTITPEEIERSLKSIDSHSIFLTQMETPIDTVTAALKLAKDRGALTILNPAPAPNADTDPEFLRYVDIITPNKTEAVQLSGTPINHEDDAALAGKALLEMGPKEVLMTLGPKGTLYCKKDHVELLPAFKVKAIDTTGAGDTFNGALATALAEGQNMREAALFGNAAAAISVKKKGAQPSIPTREEILKMAGMSP